MCIYELPYQFRNNFWVFLAGLGTVCTLFLLVRNSKKDSEKSILDLLYTDLSNSLEEIKVQYKTNQDESPVSDMYCGLHDNHGTNQLGLIIHKIKNLLEQIKISDNTKYAEKIKLLTEYQFHFILKPLLDGIVNNENKKSYEECFKKKRCDNCSEDMGYLVEHGFDDKTLELFCHLRDSLNIDS